MANVTVLPCKEVISDVEHDTNLKDLLEDHGHYVKSSCGGVGKCGECVIKVGSGEMHLSDFTFNEQQILGNVFHITRERLSCQCSVIGDVTVNLSTQDKERDEAQREIKSKSRSSKVIKGPKTLLKKREDVVREAQEKTVEQPRERSDTWFKHWDNEEDPNKIKVEGPKSKGKGGLRKPRRFEFTPNPADEAPKTKQGDVSKTELPKVERPKFRK